MGPYVTKPTKPRAIAKWTLKLRWGPGGKRLATPLNAKDQPSVVGSQMSPQHSSALVNNSFVRSGSGGGWYRGMGDYSWLLGWLVLDSNVLFF